MHNVIAGLDYMVLTQCSEPLYFSPQHQCRSLGQSVPLCHQGILCVVCVCVGGGGGGGFRKDT